jgi:hypothetical protein
VALKKNPISSLDKALVAVAVLAAKSAKLSPAEKRELKALATKGAKPGRAGFSHAERARCVWLIRRAGPESIPNLPPLPPWLRRLLHLGLDEKDDGGDRPLLRGTSTEDPLSRLEKLATLRGVVLSEAQFELQRTRLLGDPTIGTFGLADGVDPYDRLKRVGDLEVAGVLTKEQAGLIVEQVLDAT